MAAELSQILKQLEVPCTIHEDKIKGKSMVATQGIKGNTVLFEEIPIVSWSFSTRPTGTYCDWCLVSLSPDEMKEYRCPLTQPNPDAALTSCIAVYCSEDCQQRAANSHRFLCGEPLSVIRNFDLHQLLDTKTEDGELPSDGLPVTLEALAKAVSTVATRYLAYAQRYPAGTSAKELFPLAAQLFNRLVSAPADIEFDEINTDAWFNSLRALLGEKMLKIFVSILGKEDEARHKEIVDTLLSDETLGVMLGQLTLNSQALNLPVQQRRNREEDDDEDEDEDDQEDKEQKKDKNVVRPSVGAGVFALHSALNHSCDPNAFVTFTHNHEIAVKLKKSVLPGEEITITYIAELYLKLLNYEKRRERLSNYFFNCSCTRCLKEEKDAKDNNNNNKEGGRKKKKNKAKNKNKGEGTYEVTRPDEKKNDDSDNDSDCESAASEETL